MDKRRLRWLAVMLAVCLMVNNCIREFPILAHAMNSGVDESVNVSGGDVLSGISFDENDSLATVSGDDAEQETQSATVSDNDVTVSEGDVIEVKSELSVAEPIEETVITQKAVVVESSVSDNDLSVNDNSLVMLAAEESEDVGGGFPGTIDEYEDELEANKGKDNEDTFFINTYQDLIEVQNLCADAGGYEGITLVMSRPRNASEQGVWDIAEELEAQLGVPFVGIGTDTVPFKGTFYCEFDGATLLLDCPLFAYLGDGATIYDLDIVMSGGSSSVAGTIKADSDVEISNLVLSGTVENIDGVVGIFAANIEAGSSVTVSDLQSSITAVTGTVAGGIAGTIGEGAEVTFGSGVAMGSVVVTGIQAAGGYYGIVTGDRTWDVTAESPISASVVGDDADCYAGQFAGIIETGSNGTAKLTVNGNSVTVNVSGTGNGGGLVGYCGANTTISVTKTESTFIITGSVDMEEGSAGGAVGVLENAQMELSGYTLGASATIGGENTGGIVGEIINGECIISDITINGTVDGGNAGGVVGEINGGKYILSNAVINKTVKGDDASGGVVGSVIGSAAVELLSMDGKVSSKPSGGDSGLYVGKHETSLIYFSEVGDKTAPTDINEIGTYGGVYRNQNVNEKKLIGDGTLENVGVINNTISGTYQLASAADFETLAIVYGTNGAYGATAFALTAGDAAYKTLLAADFQVTKSVDISYEKTGIVTMDRNDLEKAEHAFSGSLKGIGTGITITQNNSVDQKNVGIFSTITGDVSFENLTFDGEIKNAENIGGIAYHSKGECTLTLNNIIMQRTILESNGGTIGGVMGKEDGSGDVEIIATDVTLASKITTKKKECSAFITSMGTAKVTMTDIVLGGNFTCNREDGDNPIGGLLGYKWEKTYGTITNVTVQDGTTYDTIGCFGALFGTVTSQKNTRLTLDNVKLSGLEINKNLTSSHNNCSLLVQNAQNLILEVIDYDSTGCVVNNPGSRFDEIAGKTRGYTSLSSPTGIVSIHKTPANGTTCFPEYHYENKVEKLKDMKNPYTMYFYDVFQRLEADGVTLDATLDTETEVLLWDILHYAQEGNVWNTFDAYFGDAGHSGYSDIWWEKQFSFSGNLDLSKISFYPVSHVGGVYECNNAVISFDAEKMKNWTLNNIDESSQHYALNAGLFFDAGHLTIRELTLTGNVANLGTKSGALVSGSSGMDNGWIYKVTLDDLWICDYASEPGVGLMISNIPGSNDANNVKEANFYIITMTGYDDVEAEKKAAAALIGSAGGTDVNNLVLNFKYMTIADDSDVNPPAESHNGDVLAYASFLYNYTYTDDASINKGSGLYLFSEADCTNGQVTYGEELDDDTEFSDNSKIVIKTKGIVSTNYKPYVFRIKDIEVNPKSGDILKGCGTYDDPYIIETAKQFLTLYRYINETGTEGSYQYQTFYKGWKIIAPGDDSEFCDEKHNVTVNAEGTYSGSGAEDVRVFPEDGKISAEGCDFPSPDDLSRAYYQLGADINLSLSMSTTYETIAADFVGFGTEKRPFVGVWYGKDDKGTIHTVTLPEKTAEEPLTIYGFIQYAKGAVIKDINIVMNAVKVEETVSDGDGATEAAETTTSGASIKINGMGGSVIACILGGDNIIDGVTVDAEFTSSVATATVGGYVGNVKKGGLILRNISSTALTNYKWNNGTSKANWQMLYGSVAGKVEDGFIVYEGSQSGSYHWTDTGGSTYGERHAGNYDILNIAALGAAAGEISVTFVDDTDTITFNIPEAADLQLMSMAMNADVLNIRPSGYDKYTVCGYTENSRCRKAKYSDIGCTTAVEDYVSAAQYDNVMSYSEAANLAYAYPYLYDYIGIKENYADSNYFVVSSGKGYSTLNPAGTIGSTDYHIEWKLTGSAYNMKLFGNAFRGIGALYQTGNGYGGTFHGDFDGNESTITLELNRYAAEDDAATVWRAGLFNTLYRGDAAYKKTANYAKSGETVNNQSCFVIENFTLAGSVSQKTAFSEKEVTGGGAVAYIENGNYSFDNIQSDGLSITVISNCGGLIGNVGNTGSYIQLTNCVSGGVTLKGIYSTGGFVGHSKSVVLKIVDSTIDTLKIEGYNTSGLNSSGGMVGSQDNSNGKLIMEGTAENSLSVSGSDIYSRQNTGGLVGYTNSELTVNNGYSEGNTLRAYRNMGGVAGCAASGNNGNTGIIQNTKIRDLITSEINLCDAVATGIGGLVGRNERSFTINNVSITGTTTDTCKVVAIEKNRTGLNGVGGLVGLHGNGTLTLMDCTMDTVSIGADITNTIAAGKIVNIAAGGLVGYVEQPVILAGTITTSKLNITAPLYKEVSKHPILAAGGCFGYVCKNATITGAGASTEETYYYNGLTATGNTVTGKYAGGVTGYVGYTDSTKTNIRLTGLNISDGTVTSDEAAGGVFGYICPSWSGSALHNTATNRISNMTITGRTAGGVIGDLANNGPIRMESLELTGNTIVAIQKATATVPEYSAGGIIGSSCGYSIENVKIMNATLTNNNVVCEVAATTLSANETDCLASGGIIGRMYDSQAADVSDILCDNIEIDVTNQIGARVAVAEGTKNMNQIQLVTRVSSDSGASYQLTNVVAPKAADVSGGDAVSDYLALDWLEENYGYYVGNMVGVVESPNLQMYVLRSVDKTGETLNKFTTPVLYDENTNPDSNPPVVDVGRTSEQKVDDYRSYCHIIYGAENSKAADPDDNLADMQAEVEKVNSAYLDTDDDLKSLLQEIRLSEDAVKTFENAYQENYTFLTDTANMTINFPILVYKTEYGTLQEVMEHIVNAMTNAAGASASDIDSEYLTIEPVQMLCNGTTSSLGGGVASIKAEMANGVTTYSSPKYDGVVEDAEGNQYLSYTELTFTYGWDGHKKVFRLPIFIEESILYSVHMKLMEGRVTSVDTIKEKGISDTGEGVIIANDSDYTLLLEYSYSESRENMPDSTVVEKVFSLEAAGAPKQIPVGTRLMLVDVNDGNKVYYYTVETDEQGNTPTQVEFSKFVDNQGCEYENQPINSLEEAGENGTYIDLAGHELSNVGVENFLLTVLLPGGTDGSNSLYSIHTGIEVAEDLESRFDVVNDAHEEDASVNVTAVPALKISFNDKGNRTDIEGAVSREGGLTIKGSIVIAGDSSYWNQKGSATLVDSANTGKYLDIAFYLRDDNGRVRLPAGTNITYLLDDKITYSDGTVIPNESIFYYYKDIRDAFEKEGFVYEMKNISQNTYVDVEFKFDFTGADLSHITEESYMAWMELYRTANADYPMGNNNMLDSYSEPVAARGALDLGFAVKAQDLNQLAVNTYPTAAEQNNIDFNVMFDFSDLLDPSAGAGTTALLEKWEGFNYKVTYQIYKKVENSEAVVYEKYTGDEMQLTISNCSAKNSDGTYVATAAGASSTNGKVDVLYKFTTEQFKADDGLIIIPGNKVTISTQNLTEDLTNLSNYKVEAVLTITEAEASSEEATASTTDFFIYTITKLKTDL